MPLESVGLNLNPRTQNEFLILNKYFWRASKKEKKLTTLHCEILLFIIDSIYFNPSIGPHLCPREYFYQVILYLLSIMKLVENVCLPITPSEALLKFSQSYFGKQKYQQKIIEKTVTVTGIRDCLWGRRVSESQLQGHLVLWP